jgi:hypothetical protein
MCRERALWFELRTAIYTVAGIVKPGFIFFRFL